MGKIKLVIIVGSLLFINQSFAQGLKLLPKGVWSPMLRSGSMRHLDEQYDSGGTLETLKSSKSLELDAKTLVKIAPEAQKAVDYLNNVNSSGLGNLLHLGVIELDIKPEINYQAPILAYGVNDRLTLAVGAPIINYKNTVNVSHYGSNINQFAQKFSYTPELADAFERMEAVSTEFQNELVKKGFEPLTNRKETFVGDLLLSAHYIVWENRNTTVMSKSTLNLPTGPKHNPDDLLAVNLYGKSSIDQTMAIGHMLNSKWTIVGNAGLKYTLPDTIDARVPANDTDLLPGAETKENVSRNIGTELSLGFSPSYQVSSRFSMSTGVSHSTKSQDKFSGSRGQRYDLLESDTASNSTTVSLGASYSTVEAYQNKEAKLPAIISYEMSEMVAGRNERKVQTHELWLTFFYK